MLSGWKEFFSKSQNRPYYLHVLSGRKYWDLPNEKTEESLRSIQKFYNDTQTFTDESDGFLTFLKETLMQECSSDLAHESDAFKKPFVVLDVGCNIGADIGKWVRLGCRHYYGFDSCENAVSLISRMNLHGISMKVKAVAANMAAENAWDYNNVDFVSIMHTLNYVPDKVTMRLIFKGILKCLSSKGRVLIMVMDGNKEGEYGEYVLSDADGERPAWWVTSETISREAKEAGLEVVLDENLATFAAWIGINTAISSVERQFMYYGTHLPALMKSCKTETPSGASWFSASKHRVFLLRKPGLNIFTSAKTELKAWKDWKNNLKVF